MKFGLRPGAKGKIVDRTRLSPADKYFDQWLARQPSSQSKLTQPELDSMDAGWSDQDLYFLRAAQSDGDLVPNKSATHFSGQADRITKENLIQRQFEKMMKQFGNRR